MLSRGSNEQSFEYLTNDETPYPCCQLLTAINARVFLTGEPPIARYPSPEFEALIDIVMCRVGSALRADKAHRILKLSTELGPHHPEWISRRVLFERRPVEVSVFSPRWGLHSCLAVGASSNYLCLVNWDSKEIVSSVPWGKIEVPPYAREKAIAFSLS